MMPLDALLELLERVGAGDGAVLVSEEELRGWPAQPVRQLKSQKLLMKASPAASVVCSGCEQECAMLVHTVPAGPGKAASFVVCDKRDDINRVAVPAEWLKQWRCGAEAVAAFVAQSLGLRPDCRRKIDAGLWELGLVTGRKRGQVVCLRASSALELVVGSKAVSLSEVIRFGPQGYGVDGTAIRQLVDTATTGDARYTPSNARREARKLDTEALHESWRKKYRVLKKRRPGKSDKWYSEQIAKMGIVPQRSAETIRKHMTR